MKFLTDTDREYREKALNVRGGRSGGPKGARALIRLKRGVFGFTPEQRRNCCVKAGIECMRQKKGIHSLTTSQRKANGMEVFNQKKGIHSLSSTKRSHIGKKAGKRSAEVKKNIIYDNNTYHSASEAAVGALLNKYIPGWEVEKGKTWQVRDKGIDNGGIDYYIPRVGFVEYHPPRCFYGKAGGDFRTPEE